MTTSTTTNRGEGVVTTPSTGEGVVTTPSTGEGVVQSQLETADVDHPNNHNWLLDLLGGAESAAKAAALIIEEAGVAAAREFAAHILHQLGPKDATVDSSTIDRSTVDTTNIDTSTVNSATIVDDTHGQGPTATTPMDKGPLADQSSPTTAVASVPAATGEAPSVASSAPPPAPPGNIPEPATSTVKTQG